MGESAGIVPKRLLCNLTQFNMIRRDSGFRFPRISHAAFSILEILVVMTIVSVLAAFLAPALQKTRERGRQVQCLSNMRQIGLAFRLYQNDHKGRYPKLLTSATENWQTYLGDPAIGGNYLSGNQIGPDGGGNNKFKTSLLCPTMVKRSDFKAYGEYWGYSINQSRIDISYNAGGPPWNLIQYQNADLDEIYTQPSESAMLVDGNFIQFYDGDWDAFTSVDWYIWAVIPIHGEMVNVLFLDGHVVAMNTSSPADRSRFNTVWYQGVPSTLGNPW